MNTAFEPLVTKLEKMFTALATALVEYSGGDKISDKQIRESIQMELDDELFKLDDLVIRIGTPIVKAAIQKRLDRDRADESLEMAAFNVMNEVLGYEDKPSSKPFKLVISTGNQGLWKNTEESKPVTLTRLDVPYINDAITFGELRAYFDPATWNVEEDGLIYTDDVFEKRFKEALKKSGFNPIDVTYSEQGMQGRDFISFDVGSKFLESWGAM